LRWVLKASGAWRLEEEHHEEGDEVIVAELWLRTAESTAMQIVTLPPLVRRAPHPRGTNP
jgi:hypothetical protein